MSLMVELYNILRVALCNISLALGVTHQSNRSSLFSLDVLRSYRDWQMPEIPNVLYITVGAPHMQLQTCS